MSHHEDNVRRWISEQLDLLRAQGFTFAKVRATEEWHAAFKMKNEKNPKVVIRISIPYNEETKEEQIHLKWLMAAKEYAYLFTECKDGIDAAKRVLADYHAKRTEARNDDKHPGA